MFQADFRRHDKAAKKKQTYGKQRPRCYRNYVKPFPTTRIRWYLSIEGNRSALECGETSVLRYDFKMTPLEII